MVTGEQKVSRHISSNFFMAICGQPSHLFFKYSKCCCIHFFSRKRYKRSLFRDLWQVNHSEEIAKRGDNAIIPSCFFGSYCNRNFQEFNLSSLFLKSLFLFVCVVVVVIVVVPAVVVVVSSPLRTAILFFLIHFLGAWFWNVVNFNWGIFLYENRKNVFQNLLLQEFL